MHSSTSGFRNIWKTPSSITTSSSRTTRTFMKGSRVSSPSAWISLFRRSLPLLSLEKSPAKTLVTTRRWHLQTGISVSNSSWTCTWSTYRITTMKTNYSLATLMTSSRSSQRSKTETCNWSTWCKSRSLPMKIWSHGRSCSIPPSKATISSKTNLALSWRPRLKSPRIFSTHLGKRALMRRTTRIQLGPQQMKSSSQKPLT